MTYVQASLRRSDICQASWRHTACNQWRVPWQVPGQMREPRYRKDCDEVLASLWLVTDLLSSLRQILRAALLMDIESGQSSLLNHA